MFLSLFRMNGLGEFWEGRGLDKIWVVRRWKWGFGERRDCEIRGKTTAKALKQRARRVAQRAQRFRMAIRWSLFAAFGRYSVAAMAATILSMTARSAEVPGVWLSTRMEKMTCLPLAQSR